MQGSQVSVPDCHLNRLVTHQLLNCAKVNSRHDQPTGEGVSKTMPRKILQFCGLYSSIEPESGQMQTATVKLGTHDGSELTGIVATAYIGLI